MKSRKQPVAAGDKTQSSLKFFFGKKRSCESDTSGKKSDDVKETPKKRVDKGECTDSVSIGASGVAAAKDVPPHPGLAGGGRRPSGGHNNPGRSRFFSRAKKEPGELTANSDGASGVQETLVVSDDECLPADKGQSPGSPSVETDGQAAVDSDEMKELLEAAEKADNEDNVIDLTDDALPAPAAANTGGESAGVPYYLRNFRFILNGVLGDEESSALLDETDMKVVTTFLGLSDNAQKLYVRMHNRRKGWHRSSKLEYSEIGDGLDAAIVELSTHNFLETEEKLCTLETILQLLPAPDIKELARSFRIQSGFMKKAGKSAGTSPSGGGGVGGKKDLVDAILRHCRQQMSVFSASGTEGPIKKRAKSLLGKCVQVVSSVRDAFTRLVHLFAVASWLDDDSQLCNASSTVIYNLLLSTNGSITYPQYTVRKETPLFPDRASFLRFCTALEFESDLLAAKENSQWSAALSVYTTTRPVFDECTANKLWSYAADRPQFLLRFTDGWVLSRVMSQCVDILERHRMYDDATTLLRLLLAGPFCLSSRGRWYDRLALDLDQHMKQRSAALDVVARGLSDTNVVTGHRLSLQQRGVRICSASSATEEVRSRASDFPAPDLMVAKEVEIPGRMYPGQAAGTKSYFMCNYSQTSSSGDGAADGGDGGDGARHVMLLSVEELAMEHYRCSEGFECGIHAEGSMFSALFSLFFWDIIFDDSVADVFRNAYQAMPLDFYTTHFYEQRKEKIDARVKQLCRMDSEAIAEEVKRVWAAQYGTYCGCMNWELFADVTQAVEFCTCVGGAVLASICTLLAKEYRHRRGGLPDLTLWSNKKKACKFVEVKGPNDRLSHKQHVWMHHLVEMGADVEVCHVRAVGGKML